MFAIARKKGCGWGMRNKLIYTVALAGLFSALCLVGCQSIKNEIVQSLSHMGGAVTEQDLKTELFRQKMFATRNQIIVIASEVWSLETSSNYGNMTRKSYSFDDLASQQFAFEILSNAVEYSKSHFGRQPIMAILVNPFSASLQVCTLSCNARFPVYFVSPAPGERGAAPSRNWSVSPGIVKCGSVLQGELGTRILQFKDALCRLGFPYEGPAPRNVNPSALINEYQYRDIDKAYGRIAKSPAEIEELNKCRRKVFMEEVVATRRFTMPVTTPPSDVLYISWKEYREGSFKFWSPSPTKDARQSSAESKIVLVGGSDRQLYYYKTSKHKVDMAQDKSEKDQPLDVRCNQPSDRLILELTKLKEVYDQGVHSPEK